MAALEALLFYILLPAGVAVIASILLISGAGETLRGPSAHAFPSQGKGRLPVAIALVAAPIPFGLILWFLAYPVAEAVDGNTLVRASDVGRLVLWASLVFTFAAASSTISLILCIRSRMASFLGSDFGRVLPIAVIPFTGVIFALILDFLLLGYLVDFLPGGPSNSFASAAAVDSAVSAFQAYVVATLAYPVATFVSNRIRDLSTRGFTRALLIMEMGELPVLLGLIWGFLAIGDLGASVP
jgi:hypothetical protein